MGDVMTLQSMAESSSNNHNFRGSSIPSGEEERNNDELELLYDNNKYVHDVSISPIGIEIERYDDEEERHQQLKKKTKNEKENKNATKFWKLGKLLHTKKKKKDGDDNN